MTKFAISTLEMNIYFLLWIYGVLYCVYKFSLENKAFSNVPDIYDDLKKSKYLNSKRDSTDFEWETSTTLIISALPWITVFVFVSEILRNKYIVGLPYWQTGISLTFLIFMTNTRGAFIVIMQLTLFELLSKFKSSLLIWFSCFGCLMAISFFKTFDQSYGYHLFDINETQHFLLILTLGWMNLRCVSFYLDAIKSKTAGQNNLLKICSYCFYLPNMFCGPFLFFEDIKMSQNKSNVSLKTRLYILAKDFMKILWWYFITDVSLHFLYPGAFTLQPQLVAKFNSWALYGYGYWMGQFFHLKYVVFYGFSTSIAKFENIPVPDLPKCIARIHLYSDMWKYFDRGLYSFLIKYIYIPVIKEERSFLRKTMSSILCFAFVYVWHGIQSFVFVWAVLNFVGIFFETAFTNVCKRYEDVVAIINEQWRRRVACVAASLLLSMSCVSNFYFFAGIEIGNIFRDRLINDSLGKLAKLFFMLYCCCQVSTEIKIWEAEQSKDKSKNRICRKKAEL